MAFKLTGTQMLILAVIAVLVFKPDILSGLGGDGDETKVIVNPTPTDKDLTINMYDKHNIATTLTAASGNVKVYKGGILLDSTVVHGGSVTADEDAVLTLYAMENSTTYYTHKEEYTMGAALNQLLELKICKMDTAPTINWFNENEQVDTNVSIGAGGEETFDVQIKAAADACFGNPQIPKSAGLAMYYNTSAYNMPTARDLTAASVPSGKLSGATSFDWVVYEVDAIEDLDKVKVTVTLDAKGSVDPNTHTGYNLSVKPIDKDYDFDALTDLSIMDYVDETGTELGVSAANEITAITDVIVG